MLPGGVGVIVYKYNVKAQVQAFLPAEELLLDNIFLDGVSINKIICDTSLVGLFAAYLGLAPEKDSISTTEVIVGAL